MCGSATLTIVVSKVTINWAVRITKRNTAGLLSRLRIRLDQPGSGLISGAGRGPENCK